ncbi:MAG: pyruvate, water dikinase regulatory protein [Methylococcales bacterium]
MKRTAFYISDGTGITAETVGHTLLTQFDSVNFEQVAIPFTNTSSKLSVAINRINTLNETSKCRPIVFSTLTNVDFARQLEKECNALVLDVFSAFVKPLESELHQQSSYVTGVSHSQADRRSYDSRMDAINFSLNHDDGASLKHLDKSEVIIIGVSRSGKTPTSVFLAMQFGIRAANSPLTDDDLESDSLPKYIRAYRNRLYGLTIDPERLQQIRQQRRPDSRYSSLAQCRKEVRSAEELFQQERIPYLHSTDHSIEEIATQIIQDMKLERRYY